MIVRAAMFVVLSIALGCAQSPNASVGRSAVAPCLPAPTTAPTAVLVSPISGSGGVSTSIGTIAVSFPGIVSEIELSPAVAGQTAFSAVAVGNDAPGQFSATLPGMLAASTTYAVTVVATDPVVCAFGDPFAAGSFSTS